MWLSPTALHPVEVHLKCKSINQPWINPGAASI
jgi:hypothetical protein